jgi:hypothetical protein
LNVKVTPEAQSVWDSTAKRVVWDKGRRLGATHNFIILDLLESTQRPLKTLWGDVQHSNIIKYYDAFWYPLLSQLPPGSFSFNQQTKQLRIANRETRDLKSEKASIVDFRSADADRLTWEGFGYHKVILNESGIIMMNEDLYKKTILPMLIDYKEAQLFAIGVPKGKTTKNGLEHPMYTLSKKGQVGEPGFERFHNTSYDSPVADKEDIDALVEENGGHNHPTVRQEIYGEYVDAVSSPFLHEFNEKRHVGPCEFNEQLNLYTCWDFNVSSTCLLIQVYDNTIYVLREFHQRDILDICHQIKEQYPSRRMVVNGDRNGNSESASNETFYDFVRKGLNIGFSAFRVPDSNPSHKNSHLATNACFKHMTVIIHPSCTGLIRDCQKVEVINIGGKIEIVKTDPTLTHHLDPLRYHIWMEHIDNLKIND